MLSIQYLEIRTVGAIVTPAAAIPYAFRAGVTALACKPEDEIYCRLPIVPLHLGANVWALRALSSTELGK